ALIFGGLFAVKEFYEKNVKFISGDGSYIEHLVKWAFLAYSVIWVISIFLMGGYDKPIKLRRIIQGVLAGMGVILIGYSLLPEAYRFSRAIILLGSVSTLLSLVLSRLIFHALKLKGFILNEDLRKRIAIVGSADEYERVVNVLKETSVKPAFIGFVSINEQADNQLGNINQLNEIIEVHEIQEIIFCSKNISSQQIINYMLQLVSVEVDFKIAPPESISIIGSNSIDTAGDDLYVIDFNSVSKPHNKRKKRIFDIATSLILLGGLPIVIFAEKKPMQFLANLFLVLVGAKTWVGYEANADPRLPSIKKSVLSPHQHIKAVDKEYLNKLNLAYAKDYKTENDLKIILKNFRALGN
ncbi:MAG TPA: hypothetical protein VKG26_03215, partial [Bacteroidia bacterium]|nr:hypothetical protein [Bacteroidia bacterium]